MEEVGGVDVARPRLGDADGERHHGAVGPVGRPGQVGELERERLRFDEAGVGAQHAELVAAESGDEVAHPDPPGQQRRRRPEHAVAGGMAEGVVDDLEVVEVAHDHRHRAAPLGPEQLVDDALLPGAAVADAGERVLAAELVQLLDQERRCAAAPRRARPGPRTAATQCDRGTPTTAIAIVPAVAR